MAKAKQIAFPCRSSDPQEWLAEVLRVRFNEVVSKREAALDQNNVDGVHDMRVAIRRLRSMIRDFAEVAEKFPLKELRGHLKRLADALGAVRDADVAIAALEKFSAKTKDTTIRYGIVQIIDRFQASRNQAFENLRPHLSAEDIAVLERHFEVGISKSVGQRNLFAAADIAEAMRAIIANRVDDFEKLADSLYQPYSIRRLHRLRIAGKHLRYAVELFSLLPDATAGEFASSISIMQSHLGDVHDCDAWVPQFQKILKAKKSKAVKGPVREASILLLSHFVRLRFKAYRSALAQWNEWEKSAFLELLKKWAEKENPSRPQEIEPVEVTALFN